MGTSKETIRGWLHEAKRKGATHVVVVCDTFDHEDYPVLVMPGEDVQEKHDEYSGKSMQRVMEVYAMHLDLDSQMKEDRSFHFEPAPTQSSRKAKRRNVTPPPVQISGGRQFGAVQDLERALGTVVTVRSVTMTAPEAMALEPYYRDARAALGKLISEVKRMTPAPEPVVAATTDEELDE